MEPMLSKYKPYMNRGRVMVHLSDGSRIQRAKLVMMNFLHTKNIPSVFHIHHIDGDKSNDSLENLQLMKGRDHLKLHHPNDYKYGVSCADDRRAYGKARSKDPIVMADHCVREMKRYNKIRQDPILWAKRQEREHRNYLIRRERKENAVTQL